MGGDTYRDINSKEQNFLEFLSFPSIEELIGSSLLTG